MPDEIHPPGPAAKTAAAAAGAARPITSKTAILIIHGIGEQLPFATLDQFAQGFVRYLTPDAAAPWPYTLTQQATYADNDRGCDFCLRLAHAAAPAGYLDLHEYYWAAATEAQTSLSEIGDWLADALASFKSHYGPNMQLHAEYEARNKGRRFNKLRWLRWGVSAWRVGQVGNALISLLPTPIVRTIRSGAQAIFPAKLITDYIGDVVAYTTPDRKSRFYGIRAAILKEAQAKVRALLQSPDYDQVLVVGHSLGTVIGYDVLNHLDLIANFKENNELKEKLGKLTAFFTFGSPLDKVYFFLREQAEKDQYIRRQLLDNLRLFRKRPGPQPAPQQVRVGTGPLFISTLEANKLPWVNYYHDNDDISGHLDFYAGVENMHVPSFTNPLDNKWYRAHSGYWTHEPLYHKLLEYALRPDAEASAPIPEPALAHAPA